MTARDSQPTADDMLVRMTGISKRFGRVEVLHDVDFELAAGEVHILAGENGAGKSTLIKILAGVLRDYEGTIEVEGRPVRPGSPKEANQLGISVIHQELSLIPSMSVADNLLLGRPPTRAGFVRFDRQRSQAAELMSRLGIDIDVRRDVEQFPVAVQQLIEIAKALGSQAKVIVMDEPTSALNAPEVDRLFELIRQIRATGRGVVYISHKMEEIQQLANRITVLRDGRKVATAPGTEVTPDRLVQWMVGRSVDGGSTRPTHSTGDVVLTLDRFHVRRGPRAAVDRVNLQLHRGEVLGLAGLQGSGNSHLLQALFGVYGRVTEGHVELCGRPYRPRSPRWAMRHGLALLTNDRKATGLVLPLSVSANTTLASLARYSPRGWRNERRERAATGEIARTLNVRTASLQMEVSTLSGGNQQKVALAKWLLSQPRVLLLDEPTRGVDVGAKQEIYDLIRRWTATGIAVLLVSSELPELLALSHRILVMHRGRVTGEFRQPDITADAVLHAAMGQVQERATP